METFPSTEIWLATIPLKHLIEIEQMQNPVSTSQTVIFYISARLHTMKNNSRGNAILFAKRRNTYFSFKNLPKFN